MEMKIQFFFIGQSIPSIGQPQKSYKRDHEPDRTITYVDFARKKIAFCVLEHNGQTLDFFDRQVIATH